MNTSLNTALDNENLYKLAPSIFTDFAHDSRSNLYRNIPTIKIVDSLRNEGFLPVAAGESKARLAHKEGFTKHMLRFRKDLERSSGDVNEVVLVNSHDGSSSYQMYGGVFRFICLNGMICGDRSSEIKVRHTGEEKGAIENVINGAYSVLDTFEMINEQKGIMKETTLDPLESIILAESALQVRYGEEHCPVTSGQVLDSRRSQDSKTDLWTTFNRVQENIMRGGLYGKTAKSRGTRTRGINAIDANVKLNKGLWHLATAMAELKNANHYGQNVG